MTTRAEPVISSWSLQVLADDFARNGFKVVMPDLYKGDPVSIDAFNTGTFDGPTWFANHPLDEVDERVRAVIDALKTEGVTRFGAVGYCFGARPAFNLAFTGEIHVVAVSHPSLLTIPDDIQVTLLLTVLSFKTDEWGCRNTWRCQRRRSLSTRARRTACSRSPHRSRRMPSSVRASSRRGTSALTGMAVRTASLSVVTL